MSNNVQKTEEQVKELKGVHSSIHMKIMQLTRDKPVGDELKSDIRKFSDLADKVGTGTLQQQAKGLLVSGETATSLLTYRMEKDGVVFVLEKMTEEGIKESLSVVYNFHRETVVKKEKGKDVVEAVKKGESFNVIPHEEVASMVLKHIDSKLPIMDEILSVIRGGDEMEISQEMIREGREFVADSYF